MSQTLNDFLKQEKATIGCCFITDINSGLGVLGAFNSKEFFILVSDTNKRDEEVLTYKESYRTFDEMLKRGEKFSEEVLKTPEKYKLVD